MSRRAAHDLLVELLDDGFQVSAEDGKVVVAPGSQLTDALRRRIREAKPDLLELLDPSPPEQPCPDCGHWVFARGRVGPWRCHRCGPLREEKIHAMRFAYPLAEDADERRGAEA